MTRAYYFKCWANGEELLAEIRQIPGLDTLPRTPYQLRIFGEGTRVLLEREGTTRLLDGTEVVVWTEVLDTGSLSSKHHHLVPTGRQFMTMGPAIVSGG